MPAGNFDWQIGAVAPFLPGADVVPNFRIAQQPQRQIRVRGAVTALRMKNRMEGSLAVVQLGITLVGAIDAAALAWDRAWGGSPTGAVAVTSCVSFWMSKP